MGQAWDNLEGAVSNPFWLSASTVERKEKTSLWGRPGKGDKKGEQSHLGIIQPTTKEEPC